MPLRAAALLLCLAALGALPGVSAGGQSLPSRAQLRRAVRAAERSSQLWATVNVCNSHRHPDVMGVRGQMPALGFPAELRMYFEVEYWAYPRGGFHRLPGVAAPVELGTVSSGAAQAGVQFRFTPHTGLLRGRVRYEWLLRGRVVGRVERVTRYGHASARYSDPRGFSDWKCVIP